MDLLKWFIYFLIKRMSGGTFKNDVIFNKELAEDLTNYLLGNLRKEKYTHLL